MDRETVTTTAKKPGLPIYSFSVNFSNAKCRQVKSTYIYKNIKLYLLCLRMFAYYFRNLYYRELKHGFVFTPVHCTIPDANNIFFKYCKLLSLLFLKKTCTLLSRTYPIKAVWVWQCYIVTGDRKRIQSKNIIADWKAYVIIFKKIHIYYAVLF